MPCVFIAIGANIDPERHIRTAVYRLAKIVRITGISTLYRTAPLGTPGQPMFINGVVMAETDQPPRALKTALRAIETALGRRRTTDINAPRVIDIDLVLYNALVTDDPVLPDPQIAQRPFLAIPLAELAPALMLPDSGRPIRDVAAGMLPHEMEPLPAYTAEIRGLLSL